MTLDENALRAAGLPASLISLLVSITRAAERAQAAANNAAVANDLAPQLAAAVAVLEEMGGALNFDQRIGDVDERVTNLVAALGEVSSALQSGTLSQQVAQQVAALLPRLVSAIARNGQLILQYSDGTEIAGPSLGAGGDVNNPPRSVPVPLQELTVGVPYAFDASGYVSDPDGDPLTFAMTGVMPPGMTRTGAAFDAPLPTMAGIFAATLTASDPSGLVALIPIEWRVADATTGPAMTISPAQGGVAVQNPGTFANHIIIPVPGGGIRLEHVYNG